MSNCHLIISLIAPLRFANLKLNPSSRKIQDDKYIISKIDS